jgi:hypothetical protein
VNVLHDHLLWLLPRFQQRGEGAGELIRAGKVFPAAFEGLSSRDRAFQLAFGPDADRFGAHERCREGAGMRVIWCREEMVQPAFRS